METIVYKTKDLAGEILQECKNAASTFAEKYHRKPGLAVILVGSDPASSLYVRKKSETCALHGVRAFDIAIDPLEGRQKLIDSIEALNADETVDGILLQSPIPKDWNERELLSRIHPAKDVDGFHPENAGKLSIEPRAVLEKGLPPCTPAGVVEILRKAQITVEGKSAVVIGRSNIVGKPMAQMLLGLDATVTICHSKTKDLVFFTRHADIIVTALGKPGFLQGSHIKEGAVVLDVGINRLQKDGKNLVVGDVEAKSVIGRASFLTPVPNGVGPMTIAMLIRNTVRSAFLSKEGTSKI